MKSADSVRQGILDREERLLLDRLDYIAEDLIREKGNIVVNTAPVDHSFMLKELKLKGFDVEKLDDYTFRITV